MSRRITILLHIAIWAMLFFSPLTFMRHDENFTLARFLLLTVSPLTLMCMFYLNYLWLVPKHFFRRERQTYWLVNLILTVCLGIAMHYWLTYVHNQFDAHAHHKALTVIETLVFILRDMFNFAVTAAVATGIRLASRWHHNEEARLAAEAATTEAELRNLRSQINPHFLLNTLNNIYALTAIDQTRAQNAIQQLSKLLRHILYDNQEAEVSLDDEVQFLENYVNLMKIRVADNVEVTFDYQSPAKPVTIAPLIGVSLVENAFKHGISPTEPSFIHIRIGVEGSQIVLDIENSNHPKTEKDRSGHGIGLQQVQRRLDLSYHGRYEWTHGVSPDGKTYRSVIRMQATSDNNH